MTKRQDGKKPARARAYQDDSQALGALVRLARPREWILDYPSPNDLRELLSDTSVQKDTRVWEGEAGRLVAYALVDEFNNLLFDILPDARNETLDAQIIAWGVHCMGLRNASSGTKNTLDAACRAEDKTRTARLDHFGFSKQRNQTLKMIRDLSEPIPDPILPDGFRLRAVRNMEEAEALAVLHRAAFDSDYLTTEKRLAWMDAPHYDPALDLVVVAPDGSLAASCFGLIDAAENERTGRQEGALDPVATHPNFQKRGLARACLLHGMQLMKERGIEFAVLGTGSENAAMQRAAAAAGFRIDSIRVWYARAIVEHSDPAEQETDPASDRAR